MRRQTILPRTSRAERAIAVRVVAAAPYRKSTTVDAHRRSVIAVSQRADLDARCCAVLLLPLLPTRLLLRHNLLEVSNFGCYCTEICCARD
jgi:hypothetical protein